MPDINGIPYVESTDLVSAYPAVSLALAQELDDQLASKLNIAGGKILQIVRATDTTQRSTSSTSYVDVTGMSVTITPQKSDSAIIVIASFGAIAFVSPSGVNVVYYRLADNSNNALSGAEEMLFGIKNASELDAAQTLIGYATPATTSAVTYKLRFKVNGTAVAYSNNGAVTGQMYAIEVSA